jgi:membrane-associated phospholipid phosphatase
MSTTSTGLTRVQESWFRDINDFAGNTTWLHAPMRLYAVVFGAMLISRRLGWVAVVMAVVMAFARVYVGAHFPLDVVAGLAVGAAVSAAGYCVVLPLLRTLIVAAARTPLRPLVQAH